MCPTNRGRVLRPAMQEEQKQQKVLIALRQDRTAAKSRDSGTTLPGSSPGCAMAGCDLPHVT